MTTSHKLSIEPLSTGLAPLELYSYISSRSRNSFLLESAVGTDRVISYSFLGCSPKFVLRCEDGDAFALTNRTDQPMKAALDLTEPFCGLYTGQTLDGPAGTLTLEPLQAELVVPTRWIKSR